MSLKKIPEGALREGFTTGTCATASAKAALTAIITGTPQRQVEVHLPVDKKLTLPLHTCTYTKDQAKCSVIKDAGDDPDVTHGAEVGCEVQLIEGNDILFKRGKGVGVVTLPGLELAVGEPAINPVPRQMIQNAILKLLHDHDLECGVVVTIFVTNGEQIAKKTLNERVGILEGISILGTTGIVKPYSSSSYIASIVQGIDVAVANGLDELVLNSGARSEKYLRACFPHCAEQAFIHYGNWIGETLEKVNASPIRRIHIGIMLGKAVKLAEGRTDTHSCISGWNKGFIKKLAEEAGYAPSKSNRIARLNMAGRLVEIFDFKEEEPMYQHVLEYCYRECKSKLSTASLEIYLVGKDGTTIKYKKK